ncbi:MULTISPECIES: hypothetical protein [unclassified Mesorhizobium]|uniref:hypothetical protein n=1 Tax=unclassified Mesorhizobium TaxID=325217 RepID=UPI000FCB7BB3|nr:MULTISPECIES: hypothetical protein [unclassified Mesorhizobium]RUU58982.1 hypothetical protein EOC99_23450 [Mesorhizobium sp. M7A.T.Ca.TU.009.01.1.1]RUU77822.1 hypothetical protein EOD03_21575 [Mesorhizobium sp. M7A.T.Ca.TU.009.01.1.2]RUT81909.1 hypothetical protein EOD15_32300 [Mesorhizobium sp. M7A.T.Ca.US.000.02.2.1]RUT82687.1 hypothetical protein EOD14_26645 [Mesorhizobium sp. M7A.T.Ca.US.000.02.1.1]RUU02422.1 hypothetical protein EOD12_13295 [Mesorhizobium sp. M7A.T.Ca.TU.009.02.1.1]
MADFSESTPNLPARTTASESPIPFARPGNLAAIIGRIEEVVEEETAGIRNATNYDLKASNARKSRYLYELTRAMKGGSEAEFLEQHREGLTRLRQKLAKNEAAILAHLSAVNEVASLLRHAIQRAETDGTYSAGEFGWIKA